LKNGNGNNVLLYAMKQGRFENNKKLIELLIEKGVDVNVKNSEGITPLILATQKYDIELIKLFIENGADVNVRSNDGVVPLILVIKKRDIKLIELFLEKGADVNELDKERKRAIHYVIENGSNEKLIKLLIEKGADLNVQDKKGMTPLMLAAQKYNVHYLEIIKLLRKNGAKVDLKEKEKGWDALTFAILYNNVEIVKNLLEVDIWNDDIDGWRGWNEEGILHCYEEIEIPPYTNKDHTTLCNDKGYILQDKNGNTHLMVALETKNQEIIKLVFEACYDEKHFYIKNNYGENILHKAVICGNKEMVELLISKKMNLNEQNGMFHTALMTACYRIHDKNTYEIAKLLIDAGADITVVNEKDESALSLISKVIMGRINGDQWKLNKEIFEIYEILNKKIMDIVEYRNNNQPDEEFIKKKEKKEVESLPF